MGDNNKNHEIQEKLLELGFSRREFLIVSSSALVVSGFSGQLSYAAEVPKSLVRKPTSSFSENSMLSGSWMRDGIQESMRNSDLSRDRCTPGDFPKGPRFEAASGRNMPIEEYDRQQKEQMDRLNEWAAKHLGAPYNVHGKVKRAKQIYDGAKRISKSKAFRKGVKAVGRIVGAIVGAVKKAFGSQDKEKNDKQKDIRREQPERKKSEPRGSRRKQDERDRNIGSRDIGIGEGRIIERSDRDMERMSRTA